MEFTIEGVKPGMKLADARRLLTGQGFKELPFHNDGIRGPTRLQRGVPSLTAIAGNVFEKPGTELRITSLRFQQEHFVVQSVFIKIATTDYDGVKSKLVAELGEPTPQTVTRGTSTGVTAWRWGDLSNRHLDMGVEGTHSANEVSYHLKESRKTYLRDLQ